jgi:hypothetical protein
MSSFYILNGVRRALACREAGRKTVPAIIYREGLPPEHRPRMRLANLFSPKESLLSDMRFFQIIPPVKEPISVEPLGARGQTRFIPLAKVRIR